MSEIHNETINVGLVGVGRWGLNFVRALQRHPRLRLARVVDRRGILSDALIPDRCQTVSHFSDLLDPSVVQAIIIATSPRSHVPMALSAIEQGVPVLVEKPLSLSLNEAENLAVASKGQAVPVLVDLIHLFAPAYQALRAGVRSSKAKIVRVECEGGSMGPFRADYGSLWDYGPHDLAMVFDLVQGYPVRKRLIRLEGPSSRQPKDGQSYRVELEFADGIHASILGGNNFSQKKRYLLVELEDGVRWIYDDLEQHKVRRINSDGSLEMMNYSPQSALEEVLDQFETAIRERRFHPSLRIAVDVTRCLTELDSVPTE